ncbi:MAG TPA: hypothetical protein VE127_00375 [Solirubrobacteraceae bacterium]|nr:hypothetical protein [Solirubrobacteraceae bacterium]
MAARRSGLALAGIEPFFENLFGGDASGSRWLPRLLDATPHGRAKLGELVDAPGWLATPLAVPGASGRLACFDYPAHPPRELLRWFIDHPNRLEWVEDDSVSPEAVRLRRALVCDEPAGAQAKAQDRARELLRTRSALAREWWRFEEAGRLDCVLITNRLVVTVTSDRDGVLPPATPWYPVRTRLVRDLEAARQLAAERCWATLLLSQSPVPGASEAEVARSLPDAAPHLDDAGRRELQRAYLGALTWDEAAAAVAEPEDRGAR